ncbi:MAG TPA: hypothetical protein VNT55_13480, partial [Baekduia sp.]|nr:hypothetical protein [Baekduia sp.]
ALTAARAAQALAVVVLALGGLALALWFFTANDDATTNAPPALAPGTPATDPRPWAPELREGNLVVEVSDPSQAAAVRALAREITGADDPAALLAAGQAIRVVEPENPPGGAPDIMAYAHDRALTADRAGDPALRTFLEYWLGRAGG